MKVHLRNRSNFILLLAVFQFIALSCSKKLQPEASTGKIETRPGSTNKIYADDNRVKEEKPDHKIVHQPVITEEYKNSVSEKKLDTHKANSKDIIESAEKYLGVPHCMGGTTRKCMDCSGLLVTVFAEYNIQLPHSAQEQAAYGLKISNMKDLREGDLVFFKHTYNTKKYITHSGIYIGNNKFIHTSSNTGVSITSLNQQYWKEKFAFGKRILEE